MINHLNSIRSRRRRRRGQATRRGATAVEFAMVAPAFMIVITVCVEFSRMSMIRNLAQNACYESSRLIMMEGATVQDGIDRARAVLGRAGTVAADITINGSDGTTNEEGEVIDELAFDTEVVTTRAVIRLRDNAVILPGALFGENQIIAEMSMRTERYRGYFDSNSPTN